MRIWLVCAAVLGTPVFFLSLKDLIFGTSDVTGDLWAGLLVPPVMIAFGLLLPKFGRLIGIGEEHYILERLQHDLAASIEIVPRS